MSAYTEEQLMPLKAMVGLLASSVRQEEWEPDEIGYSWTNPDDDICLVNKETDEYITFHQFFNAALTLCYSLIETTAYAVGQSPESVVARLGVKVASLEFVGPNEEPG